MSRNVCGFELDDGPVLLTGAAGFAGRSMMKIFRFSHGDVAADAVTDYPVPDGVRKVRWNLPEPPEGIQGDFRYVIHLAALSSVARSFQDSDLFQRVNCGGTSAIIEWMNHSAPDARLLFVSSAEVYKRSDDLLRETSDLAPSNPYGESKLAAEKLIMSSGLDWIISRSFPHFGPLQDGRFVLPSFCKRIITTCRGGGDSIAAGNLCPVRDYLYIDDVMSAYACLLATGNTREVYNVCSGEGHSIGELLEMLMEIGGCSLRVDTDANLLRKTDQVSQVGDSGKLKKLGWDRSYSLKKGLGILYRWWEDKF